MKEKKHYVYIINAPDSPTEAVKVGYTDDPNKRLSELQTGNPHRLKVHHRYPFPTKEIALKAEKFILKKLNTEEKKGENTLKDKERGGDEWRFVSLLSAKAYLDMALDRLKQDGVFDGQRSIDKRFPEEEREALKREKIKVKVRTVIEKSNDGGWVPTKSKSSSRQICLKELNTIGYVRYTNRRWRAALTIMEMPLGEFQDIETAKEAACLELSRMLNRKKAREKRK